MKEQLLSSQPFISKQYCNKRGNLSFFCLFVFFFLKDKSHRFFVIEHY